MEEGAACTTPLTDLESPSRSLGHFYRGMENNLTKHRNCSYLVLVCRYIYLNFVRTLTLCHCYHYLLFLLLLLSNIRKRIRTAFRP